jgi:chromosome segregation protein
MYLKRLELFGFKSFANKTALEFGEGVTAVVGPNGSGKSNVIDALRWILGENSAKNIRAEKSENLLYSGTLTRPRASFAEVKITFDNSTHFFPVDYTEVTIRRRVTRDGTSAYFINEGEVRMRDIVDFFSKARLGTKGFAIINQGNADLFIKASPVERRVMLEEVLGLRQYQIRRHDAENKLETTQINLDKAKALVEELLPSLRILRRQASRFEKYDQVKAELVQFEQQYFGAKLFELAIDEGKITPQVNLLDGQLAERAKELHALREELSRVEKHQPHASPEASQGKLQNDPYLEFKRQQTELLQRRGQIQKELGRLEAEIEFLVSRPKVTVKEAELLSVVKDAKSAVAGALATDDVGAIKKILVALAQKIESVLDAGNKEVQGRHEELSALKKKLFSELEQLEKHLNELGTMENKLAGEMREFNVLFKTAFEKVQAKQNEINALETQKSRLQFEREKIAMRRSELEHQAKQSGRILSEFNTTHASPEASQGGFQIGQVENRMFKLRGELAAIGDIDPAMIEQAKQMETRYVFLEQQISDLEKAVVDLKKLISDLKKKLHDEFKKSLELVNEEFNNYFRLMFNGGKAKLHLEKKQRAIEALEDDGGGKNEGDAGGEEKVEQTEEEQEREAGLDIELSIPRKNIKGLDLLSGGERSLVSIAVLFALIAVSPPPFLVLDEVDAALDENNTKRFANLVENFGGKTQFVIVTHNRATMSAANVLYGVTMTSEGISKLLSIKLEEAEAVVTKA